MSPFCLKHTKQNLAQEQIKVEQIVADAAYSRGERYIVSKIILSHLSQILVNTKVNVKVLFRNKEKDQYECQRGNKAVLPLKRTGPNSSGYMMKVYRSSETVCKNCPLRKMLHRRKNKVQENR